LPLFIVFCCARIRHNETIAVNPSVHGAASHTPFIPSIAGRIKIKANNNTIPRSPEINADDFASPQLVKYIELITSYPMTRNVTVYSVNPVETISATSLLHPNIPA